MPDLDTLIRAELHRREGSPLDECHVIPFGEAIRAVLDECRKMDEVAHLFAMDNAPPYMSTEEIREHFARALGVADD